MIASISRLIKKLKAQGFKELYNSFLKDSVLKEYYQFGTVVLYKCTHQVGITRDKHGIHVYLSETTTESFFTVAEDRTSLSDVDMIVESISLLSELI